MTKNNSYNLRKRTSNNNEIKTSPIQEEVIEIKNEPTLDELYAPHERMLMTHGALFGILHYIIMPLEIYFHFLYHVVLFIIQQLINYLKNDDPRKLTYSLIPRAYLLDFHRIVNTPKFEQSLFGTIYFMNSTLFLIVYSIIANYLSLRFYKYMKIELFFIRYTFLFRVGLFISILILPLIQFLIMYNFKSKEMYNFQT